MELFLEKFDVTGHRFLNARVQLLPELIRNHNFKGYWRPEYVSLLLEAQSELQKRSPAFQIESAHASMHWEQSADAYIMLREEESKKIAWERARRSRRQAVDEDKAWLGQLRVLGRTLFRILVGMNASRVKLEIMLGLIIIGGNLGYGF